MEDVLLYQLFGVEVPLEGERLNLSLLKSRYRQLMLRFHPDKSSHPLATQASQILTSAYRVLSNPRQESIYRLYGPDDLDCSFNWAEVDKILSLLKSYTSPTHSNPSPMDPQSQKQQQPDSGRATGFSSSSPANDLFGTSYEDFESYCRRKYNMSPDKEPRQSSSSHPNQESPSKQASEPSIVIDLTQDADDNDETHPSSSSQSQQQQQQQEQPQTQQSDPSAQQKEASSPMSSSSPPTPQPSQSHRSPDISVDDQEPNEPPSYFRTSNASTTSAGTTSFERRGSYASGDFIKVKNLIDRRGKLKFLVVYNAVVERTISLDEVLKKPDLVRDYLLELKSARPRRFTNLIVKHKRLGELFD